MKKIRAAVAPSLWAAAALIVTTAVIAEIAAEPTSDPGPRTGDDDDFAIPVATSNHAADIPARGAGESPRRQRLNALRLLLLDAMRPKGAALSADALPG